MVRGTSEEKNSRTEKGAPSEQPYDRDSGLVRRSQAERRRDSRSGLIEATLDLIGSGETFEGLSARRVAAKAGLAASAFYRYFESMEALGIAAVEECFGQLKRVLRAGDLVAGRPPNDIMATGVDLLATYVREQHRYMAFVAQQRVSGNAAIRRQIRSEIRIMAVQLAALMSRFPPVNTWTMRDGEMLAHLVVLVLMSAIDGCLEAVSTAAGRDDPHSLDEVKAHAKMELRYLFVGARAWRSSRG